MPLHDQAARDILTRWLSDLGKALIVAQALSDIARDRFEGGEFGAVMGSGWRDGSILPPEQMLMMMFTHSDNCLGRIVRTKVRVHELTLVPDSGPAGKVPTDLEGCDDEADEAAVFAGV